MMFNMKISTLCFVICLEMLCVTAESEPEYSGEAATESVDAEEDYTGPLYLSCEEVHHENSSAPSGTYYFSDGTGGMSPVYCHFEEIEGCGKGPWTLLMKMDGEKGTFNYNSYYWRSSAPHLPDNAKSGFDEEETKTIAYSKVAITRLCLGMRVGDGDTKWIGLDQFSSSLQKIFSNGAYIKTDLGRDKWKSLIPGSSLQPHCNKEGFNAYHYGAKARIGIIANQENDCGSPDSRLGFGTAGTHCGQDDANSVGNEATCSADNGNKHIKAFGYILSKDDSAYNRIGVFAADQMMWIYVDGKLVAFYNGSNAIGHAIKIPPSAEVIAIHGRKSKEAVTGGGILGSTSYGEKTSSSWRCSKVAEDGWTSLSFDDSHWPVAREYGRNYYPGSPLPSRVLSINRYSQWIWTDDKTSTTDAYCRANLQDDLGCPLGWEYFHGSCYSFQKDLCKNHAQAQNECRKMNSNLVSIHSRGENRFIHKRVGYSTAWIGLYDNVEENVFNWTDGSELTYTQWNPGEPNNSGDEDCVQMTNLGGWNDLRCYTCLKYVCEKKLHGCQVRNGDCSDICVNTTNGHQCSCPYPGQRLSDDEFTCEVTDMELKMKNNTIRFVIPDADAQSPEFDIHLKDPACKAEKNGSKYILEASLSTCGTKTVKSIVATVHSNSIFMTVKNPKRSIDSDGKTPKTLKVPFFCYVSENGTTCDIPYKNHITPMTYRSTKYGIYSLRMTLYDSNDFDVPYNMDDYPVAVGYIGKKIHFQLQVTSHRSKLAIRSEHCYISPSQGSEDERRYYFIKDGCYLDNTVAHFPSTKDAERVRAKVNHFRLENPYVYVHCTVVVCSARAKHSRCRRACAPNSPTQASEDKGIEQTLSAGPIIFATRTPRKTVKNKASKKSARKKKIAEPSSGLRDITYANLVILVLICVVALIVGGFLLKKKYQDKMRSQPGTYFNLSDKYGDASL